MLLDEPLEPEARPHFFVGCGDEDQVALRLEAVARKRGDRDRAGRDPRPVSGVGGV